MLVFKVLQGFSWKDFWIDLVVADGDTVNEGLVDRYPEWIERGWVDPEPVEIPDPPLDPSRAWW